MIGKYFEVILRFDFSSFARSMIRKKRLQVFIYCALQIVHVLCESGGGDGATHENKTVNGGSIEIPVLNSDDYAVSIRRLNDSYPQTLRNNETFVNEATGLDRKDEQLLLDYYQWTTDILNLDLDIDFDRNQFEHGTLDELRSNEMITVVNACDETDRLNVRNLTVVDVNTEWIFVSWESPCTTNATDEPPSVVTYSIDVCSKEKCLTDIPPTKDTKYNVTGLQPCNRYNFTVKVVHAESVGITITGSTSSNISKIGGIRELQIHATVNTVDLKWSPPEEYSACVRNYLITQCFKDTCTNVTTESEQYTAENLQECQKYPFIIRAVADTVQSDGYNITVKTNSPKYSAPRQLKIVQPNPYSLFVEWKPPTEGSSCIKHYRVTISPQPATTIPVSGTNVTIYDLHACTSYSIYINAVDEDNNDGNMLTEKTTTAVAVSKSPILDIEPDVTINSIHFVWKIEKGNSNCTLQSLKVICNATTTSGHGFQLKNGNAEVPIHSRIQDESITVTSLVRDLSPFTSYICWAYVINDAGNSESSNFMNVTTGEDIPSAPTIDVVNVTYSKFIFVWEIPKYLAGNLREFVLLLRQEEICFPVPKWCPEIGTMLKVLRFNGSTLTFEYNDARAFTTYKAKIKASTNVGWGNYSEECTLKTPPGVPGPVSNFSYLIANNIYDTNILDTNLTWSFPCSSNGILEYYFVSIYGTRENYEPHSFTFRKQIFNDDDDGINANAAVSIHLTDSELKAEYNYTFKVFAKIVGNPELGLPASQQVVYPAGIPNQPDDDYVKSITIDPANTRRSTTAVTLLLPLFPEVNGKIVYYSIIVSRIDYNVPSSTRFDNRTWPNISSWAEAMLHDFTMPYQATRLRWDPYPDYVADYGDVKAVKYTVGDDSSCKELSSSNTDRRFYCNGPLKPNTWYHVRMRAFTSGGYSDSRTFLIRTNNEVNIPLVTGVVFGILFLGIFTTMMLLARRCSPHVILRRFLHSDMSGSPVPAPFTKKKFIAHCERLIDNPGKLGNEFQLLQTLSVDLQMPTNTACLQANKKKNRYADILPYDFSRVKLNVIDNDPNTDYINASFIKGYSGEDEYIACQGPKDETTFDFWRMIEQYNVSMIVMLTELIERGKEKCHQYFPTIRETFRYESMSIKCVSELDYRSYTHRMLILQKENKKRYITHLHFKDWPDHDVPEDFDPMIHFCQIVRRNATAANKGYTVIHCSAGIGRTGTFIAIDIILQYLRDNRKLDVFGTVYRLRHGRINMVQKESQYAYIYNCIRQVLKNPYCLKSYKPPPMDLVSENLTLKKARIIPNLYTTANLVTNFEMCI